MRFTKLMLERYGRFEDCTLEFRQGLPDLHIVYGANEAGKTTSMAAVSDLLFGFGTSSPYNFRFDYSLLRVGASIEEDEINLSVRRRKGIAGSLLGADDRPIDENVLLTLLRGQTRDTFRLSFSLDQEGLRKGGKAMVQAKDDLGQALFAAGSNLTAVTAELHTLEEDADGIWGKRAAARRTYTVAEREYRESMRSIRDTALKPREWTDARDAEQTTRQTLVKLEGHRDLLVEEGRRLQRLRRIATFVRARAACLAELDEFGSARTFAAQEEALAEQTLAAINEAERQRNTAEGLRRELEERIAAIVVNDHVLAASEPIEALFEERGAVTKAKNDLQRLRAEHDLQTLSLTKLREEAGVAGVEAPGRLVVGRLREVSAEAAQTRAALREIAESEETLLAQIVDIDIRLRAHSLETNDSTDLRTAVDAARALGDDIDQRCSNAADAASRAKREAALAMQQLVPWVGSEDDLRKIATPSNDELQEVADELAELASAVEQATSLARRLGDEAALLAIEIEGLQGGAGAVSAEGLADARVDRDRVWQEIRSDIALGVLDAGAMETASLFEGKIGHADELADRRYMNAEHSGRLAQLISDRRAKLLQSEQAATRAQIESKRLEEREAGWRLRLTEARLPSLPQVRLRAWLNRREEALEATSEAVRLVGVATRETARRNQAIAALSKTLSSPADATQTLAEILLRATRILTEADAAALERRTLTADRTRINEDLAFILRRKQSLEADGREASARWLQELSSTSLVIDMVGSDARLTLFDEVRLATERSQELERRINGIERDALAHADTVTELASDLNIIGSTADASLDAMRAALLNARASQATLGGLREDHQKRLTDEEEAKAQLKAGAASLAPFLAALGDEDLTKIGKAIEGSRAVRRIRADIIEAEKQILASGDGYDLEALLTAVATADPDTVATRSEAVERELVELNARISEAARAHGDAHRAFSQFETGSREAIDAATDAATARSEMEVQAEAYILRRVQAVTLRWAIESYRQKHQDPLLARASGLFSRLTLGRYSGLRVDFDSTIPRLLGVSDDGRAIVEVGAMSEGTTDQLFLAVRLAALEQSVTSGVRLPFLADDLFVNFDDERARAGFEVLAELARSTQVLFFTHHAHLASIAREVVGAELHSECALT
ncbi:AAA family ATPase [Rhizobium beringeri]|uniref:ATP-binding protein n=1 Tax=Rhizobium beringeri TaxID=3019934 RepID=UPI003B5917A3